MTVREHIIYIHCIYIVNIAIFYITHNDNKRILYYIVVGKTNNDNFFN